MRNRKYVFVSYGNELYHHSLERLRQQALSLNIFDKVLIMSERDLPSSITEHQLFRYNRGGGYWLWKPWCCLQALKVAGPNGVVVYSDCGNTLFPSHEWNHWFDILKHRDALFFYNGGLMYQWTRSELLDFARFSCGNFYQIISNIFLLTSKSNDIIQQWYDIMFNHPELVIDVSEAEMKYQHKSFVEHRHDQAVLSTVIYGYQSCRIAVLPQNSEALRWYKDQAVHNTRISDKNIRNPPVVESVIRTFIKDVLIKPYRRIRMWFLRKFSHC